MQRGTLQFVINSNYSAALADFSRAAQLDPTFCMSFFMQGVVQFELNDKDNTCRAWQKAYELGYPDALKKMVEHCPQ